MNKQEQIKVLETGRGIQYLLDAAYKVFRNPIVMFDTYYSLIAYTDVVTDDPLWNEIVQTGTFSMAEQEFFSEERFTEDVANADKLVVMKSEKLKYDRILGHIFNREGIKVAIIVMVECTTPFGPDTQAAYGALADKISEEIRNDDHFTEFGRAYHDAIIKKILYHEIKEDSMVYTSHVQILFDGFEDYLYLAVVDVARGRAINEKLTNIRDILKAKYPSFKFCIYSGYVLMLMSSKNSVFSPEWILGDRDNPFDRNDIFAGISGSFENIYEIEKHYNDALAALKNGMAANSGQRVFLCE